MTRPIRILIATLALLIPLSVTATDLPLRDVVLFTSGVGYFERQAEVDGAATADLSFKSAQIADLIKSLVLIDEGGGKVSAVSYDSRDPIDRTLKSFSVDLTDNPELNQLLNRMRGVTVRLKTGSGEMTGDVIGVESRVRRADEESFIEHTLNLYCDGAIRQVPLEQIQFVEPTDARLQADLAAALKTLATGLDKEKKSVRIEFTGKGKRKVRVGYMLESPVWKTSYRLVLADKGPALLQGWAHIENTSDEDWTQVRLALVSGRPISFIQNLYDPIYLRRPVVQNELYAMAAPQLYEGAMEAPAEAEADAFGDFVAMGAVQAPAAVAPAPMRGLKNGRMKGGALGAAFADVAGESLNATVAAAAEGRETGELFSYPIKEAVSLPRRQSAMIPIVSADVRADKVSIYNENVNDRYPLNGIEVTNTTGLFLMQGPVTVFEDGIYAGDARLNDTARNEQRLLSYAVDLAAEVKTERKGEPERITTLKIVHGSLWVTRRYEETTKYIVRNKRDQARRYLVEHPVRAAWELVEPKKDVEKTRDAYRYRTEIAAGKTETVSFLERRDVSQTVGLSNLGTGQIEFYLSQPQISSALKQSLKKLAGMQAALQEVRVRREARERRVREITDEQNRIRENMKAVTRNSESYSMWEGKLVQQEKELDQLRIEIEQMRVDEQKRQSEINGFLADLNVE